MVRPERRTKRDLVAVVALVVAALVGATVVWWHSDARATQSEPAQHPLREPAGPETVPAQLSEAWRTPSPATPEPVTAGPSVVTGAGSEVVGREPSSGDPSWRYARDLPLCTIGAEWHRALAVHAKSANCSEVTSLQGANGERGPQRNADAEHGTRLLSDGTFVTATGQRTVESWRSDLVRTQQYGMPPTPKNVDNNMPRPDCRYSSAAVGDGQVALIEDCPRESTDRVTVLNVQPEDDEEPEELVSTLVGGTGAQVIAVTETRVAVLLPQQGEVQVFNNVNGSVLQQFPVETAERPTDDGNLTTPATTDGEHLYWHTGAETVALDSERLTPLWIVPRTLGAGTEFGGDLLVPVPDGLSVVNRTSGAVERTIPVDRGGYSGSVTLDSIGSVVLEQRGDTLVALREPGSTR